MANLVMDGVTLASKSGSTVTVQGTNVTIDNDAFPAGHIIQVKFVEFTGIQTIGNGSNGTTFVNIGSGVSGQEFSIDMSVSSGNKVLGICNVNLDAMGRYSAIKVFYDSTQIALGDINDSRARVTVSGHRNDNATNDEYIMHNSSLSFNFG